LPTIVAVLATGNHAPHRDSARPGREGAAAITTRRLFPGSGTARKATSPTARYARRVIHPSAPCHCHACRGACALDIRRARCRGAARTDRRVGQLPLRRARPPTSGRRTGCCWPPRPGGDDERGPRRWLGTILDLAGNGPPRPPTGGARPADRRVDRAGLPRGHELGSPAARPQGRGGEVEWPAPTGSLKAAALAELGFRPPARPEAASARVAPRAVLLRAGARRRSGDGCCRRRVAGRRWGRGAGPTTRGGHDP
jgi:hypothetical protein